MNHNNWYQTVMKTYVSILQINKRRKLCSDRNTDLHKYNKYSPEVVEKKLDLPLTNSLIQLSNSYISNQRIDDQKSVHATKFPLFDFNIKPQLQLRGIKITTLEYIY